jgi:hypothetical protein
LNERILRLLTRTGWGLAASIAFMTFFIGGIFAVTYVATPLSSYLAHQPMSAMQGFVFMAACALVYLLLMSIKELAAFFDRRVRPNSDTEGMP